MLLFSCSPGSIRGYKDDEVGYQGALEERNAEMTFPLSCLSTKLYAKGYTRDIHTIAG